ncbi:hypothetical protein C486_17340 [Natrinema gari JCM 14663]|uniref:Uncharacterized protein n=1 Tax=Natrinema gari JCM 14663 TaxID=1230459 RepID=L9YU60_9EURY|nr:hypothetical protein C486_17340 [Natrinema gari JCM 14663]
MEYFFYHVWPDVSELVEVVRSAFRAFVVFFDIEETFEFELAETITDGSISFYVGIDPFCCDFVDVVDVAAFCRETALFVQCEECVQS